MSGVKLVGLRSIAWIAVYQYFDYSELNTSSTCSLTSTVLTNTLLCLATNPIALLEATDKAIN